MKNASNVVSFKRRKLEKKYGRILKKNKYLFIFILIPILIACFMILDKWIIKTRLASENIDRISYIYKEYVLNENDKMESYIIEERNKKLISRFKIA